MFSWSNWINETSENLSQVYDEQNDIHFFSFFLNNSKGKCSLKQINRWQYFLSSLSCDIEEPWRQGLKASSSFFFFLIRARSRVLDLPEEFEGACKKRHVTRRLSGRAETAKLRQVAVIPLFAFNRNMKSVKRERREKKYLQFFEMSALKIEKIFFSSYTYI